MLQPINKPFDYYSLQDVSAVPIICIYYNPTDFKNKFVARVFNINVPTRAYRVADSIEEIREAIPKEMCRIAKDERDPETIVEIYI